MKPMGLDSFSDHLDRLGANLDQWPDSAQQAAQSLLRDSLIPREKRQEASRLLEQAQQLEQMFAGLPTSPASPELRRRILTTGKTDFWRTVSEWFRAALWRPIAAAAMPLVLGFAIGLFQQPIDIWLDAEDGEQGLANELSMMAFTDNFEGLPDED